MSNEVMDLVKIENNQVVTTSLKIAEYFEREHSKVISLIENKISNTATFGGIKTDASKWFQSTEYTDSRGRKQLMYLVNRNGFMYTVMGIHGSRAEELKMQFILAFESMENQLKYGSQMPMTYLQALEQLVEKEKQRIALEQKYIEEKERADEYQSTHELYESVTNKGGWISAKTVTDVLNILGLGRTNFYRFLRDQGIVTNKNQPMRCHIETKLMKARYDDFLEQYIVEFSFKGLKYIYAKLVQAKKIPSDLSEETWIKYCVDMETNEGDNNEIY